MAPLKYYLAFNNKACFFFA